LETILALIGWVLFCAGVLQLNYAAKWYRQLLKWSGPGESSGTWQQVIAASLLAIALIVAGAFLEIVVLVIRTWD